MISSVPVVPGGGAEVPGAPFQSPSEEHPSPSTPSVYPRGPGQTFREIRSRGRHCFSVLGHISGVQGQDYRGGLRNLLMAEGREQLAIKAEAEALNW